MASIRSGIGANMEDRYLFKAKHFDEWRIGNIVKEPSGLYIRDIKENVMAYRKYHKRAGRTLYKRYKGKCNGIYR